MNTLKAIGSKLQRINLAHLIDELEKFQEIADQLEEWNTENEEEVKRKRMVHEAVEACLREIEQHLKNFLQSHPTAVYEDWIEHLHPDNSQYSDQRIDHRFYVEDSDHRIMWNEYMRENNSLEKSVQARTVNPSYARLPAQS